MKRLLIKLFSLAIMFAALVTPVSNAVYSDTETSTGNTFTAGCWGPPSVPVLNSPANNYVANAGSAWNLNPVMDWNESTFVCPGETVSYQYESYRNESLTQLAYRSGWLTASQIPAPGTPEGVYYWHVKAKDSSGDESAWSAAWKITVDRTAPVTTLKYDLPFNAKTINEKVTNGQFNGSLSGWSTQGEVSYTTGDGFASALPGSIGGMVRIGHTEDDGSGVWQNRLSQQIQPGAKNLSFYYNFYSYDSGRDDPGMVVRLNGYNVFYLAASEIESGGDPNSSGWQQLSFDISQIPDPVLEIIFYSGNTGDKFSQSWVYIDNVSTAEAVANDSTNFTLTTNEPATTYYSFNGIAPFTAGNSFNLASITGSTKVYYYSVDSVGNVEGVNERTLTKDIDPPVGIDLDVGAVTDESVELLWDVPVGVTVYDLRYSLSPIDDDGDFASATQAANLPAPRQSGDPQAFVVTGLDPETTYYFAIKAGDAALNWSPLSEDVSAATQAATDEDNSILELSYLAPEHEAAFTVTNVSQFNELDYTLTYDTDSGQEAIVGHLLLSGLPGAEVTDLYLGTCSSGGTCVPHTGVTQLNLEVELIGVINRTLTDALTL